MEDELRCACGNPACHAKVWFRKGLVFFRHPDGTQETRNDFFYLDAFDWETGSKETRNIELMMEPSQARVLMWYLVFNFMPGVHHLCRWVRCLWVRFPRYWYWSFVDWWEERSKASQDSI